MKNLPRRIKYKGQIYERILSEEEKSNIEEIDNWNEDAGYYTEDGIYKPQINPNTGHIIVPKEIWDMWD